MVSEVFDTSKKQAPLNLGRVLVLGLGKTGRATLQYLAKIQNRCESMCVASGKLTPDDECFISDIKKQVDIETQLPRNTVQGCFDLCIVSPGIPQKSAIYQSAAQNSTEIISEVEFAWRESAADSTWIAITGTNGKTTVTAMLMHVLKEAGLRASAVGNIGDTCIQAVSAGITQVYVAEVSSYQLSSTVNFAPRVAVLLNITPDHLAWHGSFEAYRDAKYTILKNLHHEKDSVAVLDATNPVVLDEIRRIKGKSLQERGFDYVPVGTKEGLYGDMRLACGSSNAAFLDDKEMMHIAWDGREEVLLSSQDLHLKGEHNICNALVCAAAALVCTSNLSAVIEGLRNFAPLEHRNEPCGKVGEVACFNDSKATNVDATLKALTAFTYVKPVIMLGGEDKGTNLDSLVEGVQRQAAAAVCYGAAGMRFLEAFQDESNQASQGFEATYASNLEEAFYKALALAQPQGVVLLSPACASFDEFTSFEQRGSVFKQLVKDGAGALEAV